jgi:glycine/D-amino acid oxidase-like deaminating enzyme
MTTSYDAAVIGLGIVGASVTYALARAGARVIALDAGLAAHGTSRTSFAWLNSARKEPEAYFRLNADGMLAHRELARELGGETGHVGGGALEWAESEDAVGELRQRVDRLAGRGYAAEWIDRTRAAQLEPGLAIPDRVREVAFFADEGWLDVPRLIRVQLDAAARRGAVVLEKHPVRSLRVHGDRVDALTAAGAIEAGSVLVCVGPTTRAFLEPIGIALPVGRVPGLLAMTSPAAQPLRRVVHAPGIHLRPDDDGGLRLGSEDVDGPAATADSDATLAKLAALMLERAGRVFPPARDVTVVDYRMGVRPMPADRHTIAGRLPGLANGWVIATHSGVTLGPLLGRLLAEEIVRGTASAALAPFRPDRFVAAPPA